MGRIVLALFLLLYSSTSISHAGPVGGGTPKWFDEGTASLGGGLINCIGGGIVCGFNAVTGKLDITIAAAVAGEANSLANDGTDCLAGNAPRGIDTVGNATGCFAVQPLDADLTTIASLGSTATPTANKVVVSTAQGTLAAGWLPLPTATTKGAVLTGGNCNATTGKQIGIGTDGLPVCGVDQNSGSGGPGSQGLQDVVTLQRRVTDAVDLDSCVAFGGLSHYVCMYGNETEGAVLAVSPAQDLTWTLAATKNFFFKAADGSTIASIDNDTETFSLLNPLAVTSGGTGQATAQLAINALTGVAAATNEQCLMKDSGTGNATYKDCAGGANSISGPATTTDNAVAVYDGIDGTLLKDSLVVIDPSTGNITTPGTISAGTGGAGGGGWVFTEGSAPSAPATNTIQLYAPVDVTTAYGIALPAASTTGFLLGTNAANVNTLSFVTATGTGDVVRGTAPTFASYVDLTEAAAQSTPTEGSQRLYAKTGGAICGKDSSGTETCMGSSTLTVTRPMKMSTISVSNANAFVDTIDGTNFDYSALRFVDAVTGDTFWTYKIPAELAATPAWNVIVTSKAVSGAGGNVVLNLSCKDFATNVAFDAALTALQAATTHAISTSANTTITTLSGTNYDGTVALTAGDFLICQLSRVGGNGSDSLNVDWLVLDVSIRLDINT